MSTWSLRPDVITLDVLIPGLDGWAVLSALKADPALAGDPRDHADDGGRPPMLVGDDDPVVRELLRRQLEAEGYRVSEAADGRAALARLREGVPGVILLELMMPEMDGFEFMDSKVRDQVIGAVPKHQIEARLAAIA